MLGINLQVSHLQISYDKQQKKIKTEDASTMGKLTFNKNNVKLFTAYTSCSS